MTLAAFADICCAACSEEHLAALAPVRTSPGVRVLRRDGRVWIRWEPDDDVLPLLLPIPAVILYAWREGRWHRFGKTMPDFDGPPEGTYQPLHQTLFPAPVRPLPAKFEQPKPLELRLTPDTRPRPTTALITSARALLSWADTVPTSRLEHLDCAHRGASILVLGKRLPALAHADRYWGAKVLTPLGRTWGQDSDPVQNDAVGNTDRTGVLSPHQLPERILRAALHVDDDDLLLLSEAGADIVPGTALQPLRRASLRRLAEEAPP